MNRSQSIRHTLLAFAAVITAAAAVSADRPTGYLTPGEFDVTHVLEPAPKPGDPRYKTDREIFRATRKMAGTPRYILATSDVDYSPPALLHDFSCSVGVSLTPQNAPRLMAVFGRAVSDTAGQSARAKDFYKRERPFTIDKGTPCQAPSELYDQRAHHMSYDYPSGHATLGWTMALILASVAPDRAQPILERGRAFADSRFICGAHNESAVEGGMLSASATMSVVETKPAYQADLTAARTELNALRATGERPSGCEAEAALIGQRAMPRLDDRP